MFVPLCDTPSQFAKYSLQKISFLHFLKNNLVNSKKSCTFATNLKEIRNYNKLFNINNKFLNL